MPENKGKVRPPIVVVMGHVDHGKTTLLDVIRKTTVAEREAGGITQSIGAYEIEHNGKKITFIDTPGHEAFSKMRSRGATAADLAILVVAADEGVKPQTVESFKTIEASKTPFVVAITKIDKPNTDIEKVKNELTAAGVLLEGFGGSISYQPVSAKTGEHLNELLDLLLLAAELENLTYDPNASASGYVLESRIDRRRGLEATVIVKNGTLKFGDPIATQTAKGKIKILENHFGKAAKSLEPSAPALIIGFENLPHVGEEFAAGADAHSKFAGAQSSQVLTLSENDPGLRLILKAEDAGSLEALSQIVRSLPSEKPIRVVSESVGSVVDSDVKLALSTGAIVVAFSAKVDKGAKLLADANRIKIISSDIIYDLIKTIEEFLKVAAIPTSIGELEILAVFNQPRQDKQVVGGKVAHGVFRNKSPFIVERAGAKAGIGRVVNLQSGKKDMHQVLEGNEAGLLVSSDIMIQVGDKLIQGEVK